jgi:hypothetical protein
VSGANTTTINRRTGAECAVITASKLARLIHGIRVMTELFAGYEISMLPGQLRQKFSLTIWRYDNFAITLKLKSTPAIYCMGGRCSSHHNYSSTYARKKSSFHDTSLQRSFKMIRQ